MVFMGEFVCHIRYEKVLEKQLGSRCFKNLLVGLSFQVTVSVCKLVQIWVIFSNGLCAACEEKRNTI